MENSTLNSSTPIPIPLPPKAKPNGSKYHHRIHNLLVIGAGYVGGPTAAVIARHCPHLRVVVADINKDRINQWNSLDLPFYEPGLKEIVSEVKGKNLFFTTEVEREVGKAEMIMVAVYTPTKETPKGPRGYDLSAYEAVARTIAQNAKQNVIIVEKSTVPVKTAEKMRLIFDANKRDDKLRAEVISNPEFLAEGTAIKNLIAPDRVLIGGLETPEGNLACETLAEVYAWWVPSNKIILTNLWSSELSKLAANAFLAQRVSSINAIAALCEECGANVKEVSHVLGADERIGKYFLNASIGFGGSCFGKDLLGLIYLCKTYHLDIEAEYWNQVLIMNQHQKSRFVQRVLRAMFDSLKGKTLAILGYAFKKDTSDVRESAAIDIVNGLAAEGAIVRVYDPKATHSDIHAHSPRAVIMKNAYEACEGAHAILILTEWEEFGALNYRDIYKGMMRPAFIFDGRALLYPKRAALTEMGYKVYCVGAGSDSARDISFFGSGHNANGNSLPIGSNANNGHGNHFGNGHGGADSALEISFLGSGFNSSNGHGTQFGNGHGTHFGNGHGTLVNGNGHGGNGHGKGPLNPLDVNANGNGHGRAHRNFNDE